MSAYYLSTLHTTLSLLLISGERVLISVFLYSLSVGGGSIYALWVNVPDVGRGLDGIS
jgi:hypothetical protein